MLPEMNKKKRAVCRLVLPHFVAMVVVVATIAGMATDSMARQKRFASPEEAVTTWITAIRADNDKEVLAIFGPEAKAVIFSGDPVSDKQRREKFLSAYDVKNTLIEEGKKMILTVGEHEWPFPIPLVKKSGTWFFDIKAGKEEILNRRIGENELHTIQTMLAIVDAQREYAMADHDGDGLLQYAGKLWSDPGKKNGLYWETKEGEEPSPLGEFVVKAKAEGYTWEGSRHVPVPYYGYYYRMLRKQGKHAPEGARDYCVKGHQIGGFAVIAYPAKFGNSGVMTFLVSHDGVVYQKNLGKNSARVAKAKKIFDPDKTWKKVQ